MTPYHAETISSDPNSQLVEPAEPVWTSRVEELQFALSF